MPGVWAYCAAADDRLGGLGLGTDAGGDGRLLERIVQFAGLDRRSTGQQHDQPHVFPRGPALTGGSGSRYADAMARRDLIASQESPREQRGRGRSCRRGSRERIRRSKHEAGRRKTA